MPEKHSERARFRWLGAPEPSCRGAARALHGRRRCNPRVSVCFRAAAAASAPDASCTAPLFCARAGRGIGLTPLATAEGVCFAEKDYNLPKHPEMDVPNLHVSTRALAAFSRRFAAFSRPAPVSAARRNGAASRPKAKTLGCPRSLPPPLTRATFAAPAGDQADAELQVQGVCEGGLRLAPLLLVRASLESVRAAVPALRVIGRCACPAALRALTHLFQVPD